MATTPDEREEAQLLAAIKRAVDLVDTGGLSPNDAIEKVAREEKFGPGKISLICAAYNTGRQTDQRETSKTALDKLAAFPLADPGAVTAALYGTSPQEKAAAVQVHDDYGYGPVWLHDREREKRASAPLPVAVTPAAPAEPSTLHRMKLATAACDRQKQAADELSRTAAHYEDQLRVGVHRLVGYFKQASYNRLPFALVKKAAEEYHGVTGPLFDLVYAQAKLREPKELTKAADARQRIDLNAAPFTLVKECSDLALKVNEARAAAAEGHTKAASMKRDYYQSFSQAGRPDKAQDAPAAPAPEFAKAAALFNGPAIGALVGGALSRGLGGGVPKPKDDLIEDAWMDLEDPEHQTELNKIRTQAMLQELLTDPDDPISGYDPDEVLKAYNEIAQAYPRTAGTAATLKPALRKRLAGNVEPFETKEMTDIEKGLAATRLPTPSTSLLTDAPDKLLG